MWKQSTAVLLVLLLLPPAAFAQAAIAGVVTDVSGGVLPGATVEAVSPLLIEKARSVVTDDSGQYRIVDLPPGTYSVTFSLPGFTTLKRDGIELTETMVATLDGQLKIGAIDPAQILAHAPPTVDFWNPKVQLTVYRETLAAIPSSRNAGGIQALIPGMSSPGDSGGINGTMTGGAGSIHGGRADDSRTYADGINMGWTGGNAGGGNMPAVSSAQHVVLTTSGGMGDAEASGVVLDVIPREGGNDFSGQLTLSGSNGALQGSNYTQALKDAGLATPQELLSVYDVNPMGGGRIVQDTLWFYATFRQTGSERTVPGMWLNRNAGNPNAWTVDFDKSQQAFIDTVERQGTIRLTWQATPLNRLNFHWAEQYNNSNEKGGGSATSTIEATNRTYYIPSRQPQVSWASPITSRLYLEAGWGAYQARYRFAKRNDGTHNPLMIRVSEQGGEIPGLSSRMPSQFANSLIGAIANLRGSLSAVSAAHAMKFGYTGGFGNPSESYDHYGQIILVRTHNGAPDRVTQTIVTDNNITYARHLVPTSFYAQDDWTHLRLTLQGGVRYDHLVSSYPDSRVGGVGYPYAPKEISYPSRSTPGYGWSDITPRMGVAYDLFGDGRTALKLHLGKYMQGITGSNHDLDMNPLVRTVISTTRTWTDTNKDFVPNCNLSSAASNGECGAMDNRNLGLPVFSRSFDHDFVTGWGTRPYNWGLGVSVQQDVMRRRVAVSLGYFRNWWGNWYVVDNRSTSLADYTPFSIVAPVDSRLPGGGGQVISGLYNLVPSRVGLVDELAQSSATFARQTENWQGVDVNVVARLRNGFTAQGGTSTGRRLSDACALKAAVPEQGAGPTGATNASIAGGSVVNPYCRVDEQYRTDLKGQATYTIPRIAVLVSGTWASIPGDDLGANYTVTSAIANIGPQPLGRTLSSGNVTVNLIAPQTYLADRRNNIDVRVAKIFRFNRTRTRVGVDIYNLTNTDVITGFNQAFVPAGSWLRPTSIQPARYARINAQIDF